MRITFATAVLLTCWWAPALSQSKGPWDFAHEYKQGCSTGNMREMNECLSEAYEKVNLRMNEAYQRLLQSLKNPEPLQRAQVAWLNFRETQCDFEIPREWTGSEIPYSRNSCLIDHTERRVRDLERVVPCNGCVEFKPQFYR